MTAIDDIRIHFDEGQMGLMNFCLAFIMFGVALHMTTDDFRRISRYPKAVLVGLSSQWILLPALTVILIHLWQPPPSVALGLLLVAACPGGNISNYVTHLSGGNAALSVTLTSVVTMLSVFMTPLSFLAFAYLVPQTRSLIEAIDLPAGQIFILLLTILILPLLAGMLAARQLPRMTAAIRRPVAGLSLIIFAGFIFFAIRANWQNLLDHVHLVIGVVIVHNLLAMGVGYAWARWHRLTEYDARAVTFETGIQNAGLGLVLVFNFFQALGGMMLVTAAWAVWDLISSLLIAMFWSKRSVPRHSEYEARA